MTWPRLSSGWSWWRRLRLRLAAAMRLLLRWSLLLGALGPVTRALFEESEGSLSEQQGHAETEVPLNPDAVHLSNEEHELGQTEQYNTDEIAYVALGNEVNGDRLMSVIPGEAKDRHISDRDTGSCDAGVEGSKCNIRESLFSLITSEANIPDKGEEYNVVLEAVPTSPPPKEDSNSTENIKTPKVNCEERNVTGLENFTLQILNVSQDLMEFLNPNSSDCTLVLFYTPWCRFSASLAPHFNSLPRAFPSLHFLALDASQHSSLSTRFGTVAVPNILLFQGAKPMARFNHTDRTLETLKAFIFNQTGSSEAHPVAPPIPVLRHCIVDRCQIATLLPATQFQVTDSG